MPTALILAAAALPRAWTAFADQGVFWPDELYQSLEPAHLLAFGYGVLPWEFEDGARSWLFPGVLGALLWLLAALGLDRAPALVVGAKLAMAAVSVLGVYGALCLARRLAGDTAGWLAGLFTAAFPLGLLFGSRCMGEVASATLIVFAALALVRGGARDAALAGALAALAVFLRYPNGIVLLAFLAWLAAARRGPELRSFALAALAVGWLGGLLDWATWGRPFHSFLVYAHYNLAFQAEWYGTAPPAYYATTAWTSTGPAAAALALGLVLALRAWPGLALVALAGIAVHSLIGHKEARFLFPVVPLLLALAAAGAWRAAAAVRLTPRTGLLVGAALAAAMAQRASALTFGDAGQYLGEPAAALSPWRAGDGANRLLWLAGQQPDLCGLWLSGVRPVWVGAYAYLHRDVPLVRVDAPLSPRVANYLLRPADPLPWPLALGPPAEAPPGFVALARSRGWVLYRRDGGCPGPPAGPLRP